MVNFNEVTIAFALFSESILIEATVFVFIFIMEVIVKRVKLFKEQLNGKVNSFKL